MQSYIHDTALKHINSVNALAIALSTPYVYGIHTQGSVSLGKKRQPCENKNQSIANRQRPHHINRLIQITSAGMYMQVV